MTLFHPRGRIDRYLCGGLSPGAEARLRAHLASCGACRAYYDEGVRLLRAAGGGEASFGAGERARLERRAASVLRERGAVPAQPERSRGPLDFARGERNRWRLAALAAALLFALVPLAWWLARSPVVGQVAVLGEELLVDGEPAYTGQPIRSGALLTATRGDSVVSLDAGRGVVLREGAAARFRKRGAEAVLERGWARFSVQRERGPFTVLAGDTQVVVHGTVFEVERRAADETRVVVHRGKVAVKGRANEVFVAEGQETTVSRGVAQAASRSLPGEDPLRELRRKASKVLKTLGNEANKLLGD